MICRLKNWVGALGWPLYNCEFCVGQEPQHGCYCSYHKCFGPNDPEGTRAQRFARLIYPPLFSWYDRLETRRCREAYERQNIVNRVTAELKGKEEKSQSRMRYDYTSHSGPAS